MILQTIIAAIRGDTDAMDRYVSESTRIYIANEGRQVRRGAVVDWSTVVEAETPPPIGDNHADTRRDRQRIFPQM